MLILINNNTTVSIADCESRSAPSAHIFHMCRSMLPVYICISSVVQASVRVLLSRRASKRAAPPSMPMSFERRSREVMRQFPRSMRAMVRAPSSRSALPARLTLRKMGSCAAAAAAADADADASLAGKNGPQSPVCTSVVDGRPILDEGEHRMLGNRAVCFSPDSRAAAYHFFGNLLSVKLLGRYLLE